MSEKLRAIYTPPTREDFVPYIKANTGMPPMSPDNLNLDLYTDPDRSEMNIPFTGENTFVLKYRNRYGVFSSIETEDSDLKVLQLQGAKQEGFRVDSGLYWIRLLADQILLLAQNPESGVQRLIMPTQFFIKGLDDALDAALTRQTLTYSMLKRYEEFAARANMQFSNQERMFIRDIK